MKPSTSKQVRKKKNKNNNRKPTNETPTETRNWLDLPRDVMIHIFLKLGVIDLLFNAQSVCSSWRKIAKEPQLFRCIDFRNPWDHFGPCDFDPFVKMAVEAIDRSCGQVMEFSIVYFGTDEMLGRIIQTTSSLKCLRLATCYQVSEDFLIEAVKKLPLLEEVEMCLCLFTKEVIEVVGQSCKGLRSFRLNHQGVVYPALEVTEDSNDEALAIAANMPELRRLHVYGNSMTNNGLQTILDNCPHLEYLDLRRCCNIDLKGDLRKRCEAIKTLRLPDDSTEDCEFDSSVRHLESHDEDYEDYESDEDYAYGFSELELSDYRCYNDYSDGSDNFFSVDESMYRDVTHFVNNQARLAVMSDAFEDCKVRLFESQQAHAVAEQKAVDEEKRALELATANKRLERQVEMLQQRLYENVAESHKTKFLADSRMEWQQGILNDLVARVMPLAAENEVVRTLCINIQKKHGREWVAPADSAIPPPSTGSPRPKSQKQSSKKSRKHRYSNRSSEASPQGDEVAEEVEGEDAAAE